MHIGSDSSMCAPRDSSAQRSIQLSKWLLALFCGTGALALSAYGAHHLRRTRAEALKQSCQQKLHDIHLAILNCQDVTGRLPPQRITDQAGNTLHGWRFPLSEFYFEQYLGHGPQLNQPWSTIKEHRGLFGPACYCCGCQGSNTSFVALVGPGTAFDQVAVLDGHELTYSTPALRIQDLPRDLIVIVEVRDSHTHWLEPRDFEADTVTSPINSDPTHGISSVHAGGANVLFADGTVWFMHDDTPMTDLRKFFTIDGASEYDRDALLGRYHD